MPIQIPKEATAHHKKVDEAVSKQPRMSLEEFMAQSQGFFRVFGESG